MQSHPHAMNAGGPGVIDGLWGGDVGTSSCPGRAWQDSHDACCANRRPFCNRAQARALVSNTSRQAKPGGGGGRV